MQPNTSRAGTTFDEELIDDRSLTSLADDRFGHEDVVNELADTVLHTQTPSSIALFGAWGSGKSSIANLLEAALPSNHKRLRFTVFDASKYAETPLRRHFISQVAFGLSITDERFHKGLYESEDRNDVTFPLQQWTAIAKVAALVALAALVVVLAVAGGIAAIGGSNYFDTVKRGLALVVPGAAVVGGLLKVVTAGFTVKLSRSAPSGDEEFERTFKELVGAAKTERLVVFIDELDRCSPAEVASVLETLKTFLSVPGCVFVVAADQQVLEQALREKVSQHTPEDPSNPYYSAGSAYLDKVFQHQLALPPVKPTTLTRFALGLVAKRAGIWQEIPQLDEVISVLIPTHVASARRVKVLLNRYRAVYRLARARAGSNRLDPNFYERATELAKLVCLQCEFPLFADALTIDARMPELVLKVADGESLPHSLRSEVRESAESYAKGRTRVAELLVATSDEDGDRAGSRGDEVARAHSQQLVDYLRKTELVPGPGPDLVYLESAGAAHGVDAIRAERLHRAAVDNNLGEVLRLIEDSPEDEGQGSLLVLADVVRDGQPGLEGRNAVSALLQSIERSGIALDGAADTLADAVAGHLNRTEFEERDLGGALLLAAACSRDVGPRLLHAVLMHEAAGSNGELSAKIIEQADSVSTGDLPRLAEITKMALIDSPAAAAAALNSLQHGRADELLGQAADLLEPDVKAFYKASSDKSDAADPDPDPDPDPSPIFAQDPAEALGEALDALEVEGARKLMTAMLSFNERSMYAAARGRVDKLAPIGDEALVWEILCSTAVRPIAEWPTWLNSLDARAVADLDDAERRVDELVERLWRLGRDDGTSDAFERALAALGSARGRVALREGFRDDLHEHVAAPFPTEAAVETQRPLLDLAQQFVEAGLANLDMIAGAAMDGAVQTLLASPSTLVPSARAAIIREMVRRVTTYAHAASSDRLEALLPAADESTWLTPQRTAWMRLLAAAELRRRRVDVPVPVSLDAVTEFAAEARDTAVADEVVAQWLVDFAEDEAEVWQVIRPLVADRLAARTWRALARFVAKLADDDHLRFVDRVLTHAVAGDVDNSLYEALALTDLPERRVADRLIELYSGASNLPARKVVMSLWRTLSPSSQAARRRLVERIYIPLAGSGAGGFDTALSFFGLVAPVDNIRNEVRAALRSGAPSEKAREKVEKRFEDAGWRSKKKLLRKQRDL